MERWASPCRAALLSNVLRSPSTIRPGGPCHGSPGPGSLRPGERVLQVTEKNLNTSLCSVCDRSPPTRDPPAFLQEKHAVVITGLPGKLQSLLVLKRPFARSRAKRQVRWLLTTPHHARCSSHHLWRGSHNLQDTAGCLLPRAWLWVGKVVPLNVDEARKVFSDLTPGSGHQTEHNGSSTFLCFENLKTHVRSTLYQPGNSASHRWTSAPPFPWFWVR